LAATTKSLKCFSSFSGGEWKFLGSKANFKTFTNLIFIDWRRRLIPLNTYLIDIDFDSFSNTQHAEMMKEVISYSQYALAEI
jgi:hypothetical protein